MIIDYHNFWNLPGGIAKIKPLFTKLINEISGRKNKEKKTTRSFDSFKNHFMKSIILESLANYEFNKINVLKNRF